MMLYTFSLRSVPLHIAFSSVSRYVIIAYISSLLWGTPLCVRDHCFAFIACGIALDKISGSLSKGDIMTSARHYLITGEVALLVAIWLLFYCRIIIMLLF